MHVSPAVAHEPKNQTFLRTIVLIVAVCAVLVVGFGAGMTTMWFVGPDVRRVVAGSRPTNEGAEEPSREERSQLLWEIWDILDAEYIEPEAIGSDKMIYGAASGMVSTLGDPHTSFMEPLPAAIMDEDMRGSFEGIGATVDMVEGQLVIIRPLPSSPALGAGLKAGDIILEVDGESLEGKTLVEAISIIRGPEDTVVRLLVQREGEAEPFVVPVTRAKVELTIVESRIIDDGVAYLRLSEFNALSQKRVHQALEELLEEGPSGLIFDLRGNPGGFLQMSIDVASEFLPKGTLVVVEEERGHPLQEYRVKRPGLAIDVPLVVLIDGGSASASEIVAGALRDQGRATLIGQRTFGKGSVQSAHRLSDGSSLRVTVAKWYLPDGDHLDGQGIEPDLEIARGADDMAEGRDTQLERAVAFIANGERV